MEKNFKKTGNEEQNKSLSPSENNYGEVDDVIVIRGSNDVVIDKIFPYIRKQFENFKKKEKDMKDIRECLLIYSDFLEEAIIKYIKQNESLLHHEEIDYMALIMEKIDIRKITDEELMDLQKSFDEFSSQHKHNEGIDYMALIMDKIDVRKIPIEELINLQESFNEFSPRYKYHEKMAHISLIINEIDNRKKEIMDEEIIDLERIKKRLDFCLEVLKRNEYISRTMTKESDFDELSKV